MKVLLFVFTLLLGFNQLQAQTSKGYNLTVQVEQLRNSDGVLQVALYNKDKTIPDQHYKNYYLLKTTAITNNTASITFTNLPKGTYAVNILHDENKDGKIDKKFVLPKEGVGFSNYTSINLANRPNFKKASFELMKDKTIKVKVIYF